MNVLILTSTFPDSIDSWNGVFVKEQASALAKEHNIFVVRCRVDYNSFNPFFSAKVEKDLTFGYPVYRITVSKSFPVYNQINYLLTTFWRLRRIIKEHKTDMIHCHYSYPSGIIAAVINYSYKIPYVVTEHTRIKTTFRSYFHRVLSIIAMKRAKTMIAVSNSLKQEIVEHGINNVAVIPNVTNIERFSLSVRSADPFIIGFLGSLNTKNKGLDILLNACDSLPFNFTLKIGGEGKYLEYYKRMSKELQINHKCNFVGNINQFDIPYFYSDISLFVLTSRYETFGIVLVEAMAAGVPVIATKCGGPADIVNESNGVLVDIDNPKQLKEALVKVFEEYSKYSARNIRDYANVNFSAASFLSKVNQLYSKN